MLPPKVIEMFVRLRRKKGGETATKKAFRKWVRDNLVSPPGDKGPESRYSGCAMVFQEPDLQRFVFSQVDWAFYEHPPTGARA